MAVTDECPEPPIVDAHAHIFTRAQPLWERAWTRPDYDYAVETFLADLDAHGIAFGVIAAASLFDDYNDYVLEALRRHKRLRATVRIRPETDAFTLERMAGQGVVGVRFQWPRDEALPDLTGHTYQKLFHRMAALGLHAELNVSGERLVQALPALRGSGVRIVIDHFGLLRATEGLDCPGFQAAVEAARAGTAWIKISAGFRLPEGQAEAYAPAVIAAVGPDRVFWGSDAPFVGHRESMTYARALGGFYAMVPDAPTRRRISDAALRFYFF